MPTTAVNLNSSDSIKLRFLACGGSLFLKLLMETWRWKYVEGFTPDRIWEGPAPRILIFWHGRQLMMPAWFMATGGPNKSPGMHTLISRHGDGRLIAKIVETFGIHSIAGSSSRGAIPGSKQLIEKLQSNQDICITPDGPRGPARKLKLGVIKIAQISGAKIYPVAVAAKKRKVFGSWDQMQLPLPFSEIAAACAEGIKIPLDADEASLGSYSVQVETALNQVTDLVDQWVLKA